MQSRASSLNKITVACALALLIVAFVARREARRHMSPERMSTPFAPRASTPLPAPPLVPGSEFHLESNAPYKLFTSPEIRLRLVFEKPARSARHVRIELEARDFFGALAARQSSTFSSPPNSASKIDLPVFSLPRLGWYQIQVTLRDAATSEVLAARAQFVGRTFIDPNFPIPTREQTGWDDLITHRMIGMSLHRFDLNTAAQIDEFAPQIKLARQLKIPYFILLIWPETCSPESIRHVLEKLHALGDDAPRIEIVNEPNLKMRASRYIEILKIARAQIKAINPRAQVLGPALCGAQLFWIENFLSEGGGDLIDVFTLHSYERYGSIDADHWLRKFAQVRALLKKYKCQKPLWQTEHGFVADVPGLMLRPQWQARELSLEQNALARFGVGPDEYFYYYINEGGYRGFASEIVDGARELYPAALFTRVRAHFLNRKKWRRAFDFGSVGNRLLIGDEYSDGRETVAVLQNCGALQNVAVKLNLKTLRVFDSFGNALAPEYSRAGETVVRVGRTPLYVFAPRETKFQAQLETSFGTDIAPQARVLCDDVKAQDGAARLTNDLMEFDFLDEPLRAGMVGFENHLPLDVTLQWSAPKLLKSAVLYGSLADNEKSTPLSYELFARQNGAWKKVGDVHQKPSQQFFAQGNSRITDYDNSWIFIHQFGKPIPADALRFHFLETTRGQIPTDALASAAHSSLAPRVELREVQVFASR